MSRFDNFEDTNEFADRAGRGFDSEMHSHTHIGHDCRKLHHHTQNRYHSFAPQRAGGKVKWFVDGCGYFWALSVALEEAQHKIWIMAWWLSPEVYLRRPPSKNEKYRLDRMLQSAASRGVKVEIILHNEVEAALSFGSIHTKHALEALHANISVFRCPDHNWSVRNIEPDSKNLFSDFHDPVNIPYYTDEPLDWVYHEKLCVVDERMVFMGGVDICFGRWDTNDYPIADAHPNNLDDILFPGQDYNNARVFDFRQVDHPKENKLDRTKIARMGWTDLSICLEGPVVEDIRAHFVQRWNFEYDLQYGASHNGRYHRLALNGPIDTYHDKGKSIYAFVESAKPGSLDGKRATKLPSMAIAPGAGIGREEEPDHGHHFDPTSHEFIDTSKGCTPRSMSEFMSCNGNDEVREDPSASVQLLRSVSRWSHGTPTEHSIANAYVEIIEKSRHFIYIENQYFITATTQGQEPMLNKIGAAIVKRITRAAEAHEKYKVIVVMPAVPAFAGDLQYDSSPGTLAIMGLQYKSISRGEYSIMEKIKDAGFNPKDYISFYNLRSYDRIDIGATMANVERKSEVTYESARKEHDDNVGAGYNGRGEGTGTNAKDPNSQYARYQQAADSDKSTYTNFCSFGMHDGLSVIPWTSGNTDEIDAIVSEEVYVHSKFLIADDRVVIVGSANLNDRSQLGYRDSEIAVVIEDTALVDSLMNGELFYAGRFAASLRRQVFRKHLGLLPRQAPTQPDDNFLPVNRKGNNYDWGSDMDRLVEDPLSDAFEELWMSTARANTEVFEKVFRPVPSNAVRNWDQYDEYYGQYFMSPNTSSVEDLDGKEKPKYQYGHVFRENFPGGVQEVKRDLQRVKGTLVEMPLDFLVEVGDLEKEGFGSHPFREDIYA